MKPAGSTRCCALLIASALSIASSPALRADEPAAAGKAPAARARLGMNLNGPADWNTELPFVDVFRLARPWVSQTKGKGWGKGPELELDEHGWVKRLAPDCWAETPVCTIDGGHYPAGRYTVFYDGKGKLDFWGAAKIASQEPGQIALDVDSSKGGFFVRLTETDPDDYVRNIRIAMPGFEKSYQQEPFHPAFLNRWQGVACLRFMDWMKTNGSEIATWSQRPKPEDATFSAKGVPVEVMVDLCNRLQADAWFCIPHKADDEYVGNFARLVKSRIDPGLKVYIEYSNDACTCCPLQRPRWAGSGRDRGHRSLPPPLRQAI